MRTGMVSPVAGTSDAAKRRAMSADAASVQMTVDAVSLNSPRATVRLSGCGTIAMAGAESCATLCAVARSDRTAASAPAMTAPETAVRRCAATPGQAAIEDGIIRGKGRLRARSGRSLVAAPPLLGMTRVVQATGR